MWKNSEKYLTNIQKLKKGKKKSLNPKKYKYFLIQMISGLLSSKCCKQPPQLLKKMFFVRATSSMNVHFYADDSADDPNLLLTLHYWFSVVNKNILLKKPQMAEWLFQIQ